MRATTLNDRMNAAADDVRGALNIAFLQKMPALASKHGLDGREALTATSIGMTRVMVATMSAVAEVPVADVAETLGNELLAVIAKWLERQKI